MNKKQSIEKMKDLKLNFFPLQVFDKNNIESIKEFFEKNSSEEYVLRTVDGTKGVYFYVSNFLEAKEKLPQFEKEVTISVSYRPFKNNIVLVGDIKISKVNDEFSVDLIARSDSEATNRNIYENPQYNLHTDLMDENLWGIRGVEKIIRYIAEYNLIDYVVEFSVYNKKIGINQNEVVIAEIRKDY